MLFPQTLISVRVQQGFDETKHYAIVSEKDPAERELGERPRGDPPFRRGVAVVDDGRG